MAVLGKDERTRSIPSLRYSSRSVWRYQSCFLKYRRTISPVIYRNGIAPFFLFNEKIQIKHQGPFGFLLRSQISWDWRICSRSASLVFSVISRLVLRCSSCLFAFRHSASKSENQGASFGEDTGINQQNHIYIRGVRLPGVVLAVIRAL